MASNKPMSEIEIRVSCNKLKNKDITSKSDPRCIFYMMKEGSWIEVGRTETIMNNLDPCFETSFNIEYVFDDEQLIRFDVWDIDHFDTEELKGNDFLGQLETSVSEVVSNNPLTLPLVDKKDGKPAGGTITLRVKDTSSTASHGDTLQLTFKAEHLDKKNLLGKSDPYLEFCRQTIDGSWEIVHRTEVVKNSLNPSWAPFKIKAFQLSGGDNSNPVKVVCRDWKKSGKHDEIGAFRTSVSELIHDAAGRQWPCINEAKVDKKKYESSGIIFMTSCEIVNE